MQPCEERADPALVGSSRFTIYVLPQKVFHLLLGVIVVLTALSLIVRSLGVLLNDQRERTYIRMFDVGTEWNFPTWYQVIVLAIAGILTLTVAWVGIRTMNRLQIGGWTLLGTGLLLMSVDEMTQLHERVGPPIQRILNTTLYWVWVIPFVVLLPILLILMIPMLRSLPQHLRRWFLIAGTIFVSGAIGLEVGQWVFGEYGYARTNLWVSIVFESMEETFEMLGIVLYLRTLLEYIGMHGGGARVVNG